MSDILENIFKDVFKEQEVIKIRVEKRRGRRRQVTIIEGIDEKLFDHRELVSKLKSKLACGGTAKNGRIELQGDHRYRVRELLIEMGFSPSNIIVEE
ncbi:MAG: stress response translation initiation inhibitor YciH [Thermoprotei archaeon]|nr:MAG: stress response translation initiation inhibitor YciH [Thermoprotei archaeon]RLF03902.1 MAG: stress response translation initiation inhibitor YciH [Thermoprotei archaeon]